MPLMHYSQTKSNVIGLADAIIASINRAQRRIRATNAFWEAAQVQALTDYGTQLGTLLNAQPNLLTNLQNAFIAAGETNIIVTPNDVFNLEADIAPNGLSPSYLDTLIQLGFGRCYN